ncbi:hypothetical protein PVV74_03970 [Roseovarius sp. SK2]|uniref:hypothetical protein n=1 Tax=Roseovarius sp. SK2 TaxID=3028381 RepID=UPI00237C1C5D|nr:hypothetical protein [Roseovarius sp. SK2]MDD9724607.1 hypothetical protein [Roseovarius sp. SK2]
MNSETDLMDQKHGDISMPFQGPVAAPLGTDDEAAGTPPSAAQVSTAMQREANRYASADRKPGSEDIQGDGSRQPARWVVAGFWHWRPWQSLSSLRDWNAADRPVLNQETWSSRD